MAKAASKASKSSGGRARFGLGLVVGMVLAAGCVAMYPKSLESWLIGILGMPRHVENREMVAQKAMIPAHQVKPAPFGTSEDVFEAGAHVYKTQCASCHGTPGHDVAFARYMDPIAPQLWKKHTKGNVVGVSDDEAGETYWKVANGVRLTGMPSYDHVLSDTQMWQVSLLLKNADQQLPDPVMGILTGARP